MGDVPKAFRVEGNSVKSGPRILGLNSNVRYSMHAWRVLSCFEETILDDSDPDQSKMSLNLVHLIF